MKEDILRVLELAKGWNSDMPNEKEQPFSIIPYMYERISTKELLHSEIIAELLRPDGKHGCSDLFLREFMNRIGIEDPQHQDFSKVEVKTESYTAAGRRIDILIVWGNNAVIIENKLNNAADQPDQLKDYLKDTKNKGKTVQKIVYIPLYAGKKSPENVPDVVYLCPQHLSKWLEACARKSQEALHVVSPYIQLLNYMNQSNRNYMKAQELYELLAQDPKLMDAALNIAETINNGEWKNFLRQQLLNKVTTRLNAQDFWHEFQTKTSELWLWLGSDKEHKYWVSVDVCDKYYLYLYYYDEQTKPEGENIIGSGQSGQYYYYLLSDTYRIGNEADTEALVSKVVELLKNSRK